MRNIEKIRGKGGEEMGERERVNEKGRSEG
jgi:hypothetical protein